MKLDSISYYLPRLLPVDRQTILTKFIPAGNVKGSRIKATCTRGSIMLKCDDAKSMDENHDCAVTALLQKFIREDLTQRNEPVDKNPWGGVWVRNCAPDCLEWKYIYTKVIGVK